MTEEVKQQNDTKQPEENSPEGEKKATGKTKEKILEEIEFERQEKMNEQRFGYFSIPYPAIAGDEAYSQNAQYHHKVVDRKVITENRGIYVQGPKSGKGPDAYFPPPEITETLQKQKDKDEESRKKKEEQKVKEEKEAKAKLKERNPFQFKPAGPQLVFSFYKKIQEDEEYLPKPVEIPEGPLTKEPDKKRFKIDHFKVKTSNRNIQAAPNKSGTHPNDYFSFYVADEALQAKLAEMNKKDIADKIQKVKDSKDAPSKIAFKPAALKLCEPFSSDKNTYQLHKDEEMEELVKQYKANKAKGNPRYQKPPNPVQHPKPFSPARMAFDGRAGLFMYKSEEFYLNNDIKYTKEFQKAEKERKELEKGTIKSIREIREMERQSAKKPFTYNKLMKSSTFAPPISSYLVNIKREFPSIKFH